MNGLGTGRSESPKVGHATVIADQGFRKTKIIMFVNANEPDEPRVHEYDLKWLNAHAAFLDCVFRACEPLQSDVVRYVDNGVMMVFPDGDLNSVVEAAIRIQESVASARGKAVLPFISAIGIAMGRVVEVPADARPSSIKGAAMLSDYFGSAVNRAASICANTPTGAVWVDAECRSRIERDVDDKLMIHLASCGSRIECYEVFSISPRPKATGRRRPQILSGKVRTWNEHTTIGIIDSADGERFYVDELCVAHDGSLVPGAEVLFIACEPFIPGKNRVAGCVLSLGRTARGEVTDVPRNGRPYGFAQVVDLRQNTQTLLMLVDEKQYSPRLADRISFTIDQNQKGSVAENPQLIEETVRKRPRGGRVNEMS